MRLNRASTCPRGFAHTECDVVDVVDVDEAVVDGLALDDIFLGGRSGGIRPRGWLWKLDILLGPEC